MDQLVLGYNLLIRIAFACLLVTSVTMDSFIFAWLWLIPIVLAMVQSFLVGLKVPNRQFSEVVRSAMFFPDEIYYLRTLSVWLSSVSSAAINLKRDGWKVQANAESSAKINSISGWIVMIAFTCLPALALVVIAHFTPMAVMLPIITVCWFILAGMTIVPTFGMLRRILQILRHWRTLEP